MYTVFLKGEDMQKYTLHKAVLKRLDTLKSETLKDLVKGFIHFTPIDFMVISNGAFRTAEEQHELFLKEPKVTNCDGYKLKSAHQSGLAVDLVPWVNGKPTWDKIHTSSLGASFKTYCNMLGVEVIWGGDWDDDGDLKESFFDPAHFQIEE